MGTLQVGRVGLSSPTIPDFEDWSVRADEKGELHRVSLWLQASSTADAKAMRSELLRQTGQVVPVTYTGDDSFDGFFKVRHVSIDTRARHTSLQRTGGLFQTDLALEWVGGHQAVEFLSNYAGLLITNDHGLTAGEVQFVHAPPVAGDDAYFSGGGATATARTTEDGSIPVFLDVPLVDNIGSARWSCSPANYLKGAARIDVNGYTRAGRYAPMTPESFVLGNGICELRADQSGGTTTGDISIRGYNPSNGWGSWIPFDIVWNSSTDIPEWHLVNIVRNGAHAVSLQLVRDADDSPPTDKRHWLTFTLRRGQPFVTCHFTYSSNVALTIDRAAADAASAITPTGASSAMAARDTTADSDGAGNQWVIGAADVSAVDTTNGGIDMASAASHSFFMGFQIDGASADSNNDADAIARQYLASLTEIVQPTLR